MHYFQPAAVWADFGHFWFACSVKMFAVLLECFVLCWVTSCAQQLQPGDIPGLLSRLSAVQHQRRRTMTFFPSLKRRTTFSRGHLSKEEMTLRCSSQPQWFLTVMLLTLCAPGFIRSVCMYVCVAAPGLCGCFSVKSNLMRPRSASGLPVHCKADSHTQKTSSAI